MDTVTNFGAETDDTQEIGTPPKLSSLNEYDAGHGFTRTDSTITDPEYARV